MTRSHIRIFTFAMALLVGAPAAFGQDTAKSATAPTGNRLRDLPAPDFQLTTLAGEPASAKSRRAKERGATASGHIEQRAAVANVIPKRDVGITADDHATGGLIRHVAKDVGLSVGECEVTFISKSRAADLQRTATENVAGGAIGE